MTITHPIRLIVIGSIMVLFGVFASFAMVLRVVETTYWLSFLAYICSIMGSLFGIIGGVEYNSQQKW